jgi:membrane protein
LNTRLVQFLCAKSKKILLPGFDKVPLYDVIVFFINQTKKVGLNDRAAAVSFNFLMAIPSATIFLFTLIPYMPISKEITKELLDLTRIFAPNENTYDLVKNFLNDFLNTPRSGLLSVGFLLAVYYASNAVMGIMRSFNRSFMQVDRSFYHDRLTAIRLTTVLILLIIATVLLLVTQGQLFSYLMSALEIENAFLRWLIHSVRWIIIIALVLYAIGFIYKYAPAIHKRWKLASPGAIFATFLIVLFTLGFSFYVQNFGSYNKIYGSIGTILILMLLIYINSLILLIGYELNVSIHSLKAMADERQKHETSGELAS